MSKIRIGILRGGTSHEHETSLLSGTNLAKIFQDDLTDSGRYVKKYLPSDIFVDKNGIWHVGGAPKTPIDALQQHDVIINALHGEYGEDGTVQKILEQSGVPYVGNPVYPSTVTFNKEVFKQTLRNLGIKTPVSVAKKMNVSDNLAEIARELFKTFPLPAIIKPQSGSASVGVSVATNFEGLLKGLQKAITISDEVLIEEYIPGTEIVSGFVEGLGGQDTYILLPVAVTTDEKKQVMLRSKMWTGHLNNEDRYLGRYEIELPRGLTDSHRKEMSNAIKKVKDHLGMRHYATFDFILSPRRGLYLIEADTSPHLAENAPLLTSLREAGVKARDFFKHVVGVAMGR